MSRAQPYHAPLVWGADGREIRPQRGALVPAGALVNRGAEFVPLAGDHIWALVPTGCNDMGTPGRPKWALVPVGQGVAA